MKIIFDTEEQKEKFLQKFFFKCPSEMGCIEHCDDGCKKCWEQAIECEVAGKE